MAQQRTTTSVFGVSRRENHDASDFYARFVAPELNSDSTLTKPVGLDQIWHGDARSMDQVADGSVALVVTSPPYFAGKQYEQNLGEGHVPATYLDYLAMLEEVFAECDKKLEPGGRIAVNVANLGRKPYRSLSSDVITILQDKLRLLLRGEIVWQKARGSAGNCAWGSFQRPANPVLRDLTERVVVASKGRFDRALPARKRRAAGHPSEGLMNTDEFLEATTDVWEIPAESARRVGHPAPFPVELPGRLMRLYTYEQDLVLDPFMGSGTTAVAAIRNGRHFVGYDTDAEYVAAARLRVTDELSRPAELAPAEPAGGRAAKLVAEQLLAEAGFADLRANVRAASAVDVSFAGLAASGTKVLFELCGGFTAVRPGLRRADALWRALGKAAVLAQAESPAPLVLLTTALPEPGSPGDQALGATTGPGKPVAGVVLLDDPAAVDRLAELASS